LGRSSPSSRAVGHVALGRAGYAEILALQRRLRDRRIEGTIGDLVLTVEHEPTFTVGRRGSRANLLVAQEALDAAGIQVFEIERGGDITYHGPGQLVIYPILDLRGYGRDLRGYVERLEETTIRTIARFGVEGRRDSAMPGVWVDGGKIASIGVHVRRWVTVHGLALNVDVDRDHFAMIRPCGLDVTAVSMSDFVDAPVDLATVRSAFLEAAADLFGWSIAAVDRGEIEGGIDGDGS